MKEEVPSATDLELFYRVENEPAGTFKKFGADKTGVENNITQHFHNIDELSRRIKSSIESQCYIEVISLRLQIIDYWLRVFFTNKNTEELERKREFGQLLRQAFELGLPKEIYDRLCAFNKHRIDAIHGFVIGTTNYETISKAAIEADQLLRESVEFVIRNTGEVVTHRDHLTANPGAITVHVDGFCKELRQGAHY